MDITIPANFIPAHSLYIRTKKTLELKRMNYPDPNLSISQEKNLCQLYGTDWLNLETSHKKKVWLDKPLGISFLRGHRVK